MMPSVVGDVSARDFQQRIDSGFGRGSSGRKIVVQSSGRPFTRGFAKHHDSQQAGRHVLHIGARNANCSPSVAVRPAERALNDAATTGDGRELYGAAILLGD